VGAGGEGVDKASTLTTGGEQNWRRARYDELARFSRAISNERTFDALIEFVAREAAAVMGADRSSVFLLDPATNELWSRVALGIEGREIRFPANRGIAGHVISTGELLNVPDPYVDSRFNPAVDRETGYRTKSILCAPLRAREGSVIGALQMLNKVGGGAFNLDDEHLAETLAAQCAVALENAQMYEQLRAAEQRGAEPETASPKVLLADGDASLESTVTRLLGSGLSIVRAFDGEEALAKARAERPDLVVVAMEMDGKDGFEVCRALRAGADGRHMPVIILSASRRPEDVIRAFEAGANDYMVKPFTAAQLRAKTHTWLLRSGGGSGDRNNHAT
jgi:CheY-like chemotaxis protein